MTMLESVKLQKRQSEIRQQLATLAGKDNPDDNEVRSMTDLDKEYTTNEVRFRAALVSESEEREQAGKELETRSETEWNSLLDGFEMRQVCLALDEGAALSGQTNEVVTELRSQGGFQGLPVPWLALEQRAGETVAADTPNPRVTRNLIARLFPASVMGRMGFEMINVGSGEVEVPITTAGATVGWQTTETGDVGTPNAFTTVDRPMTPSNTMGAVMQITRKSMKQSGQSLENAIRRDMAAAIGQELDRVAFLGAGASGEPAGLLVGSYGFTSTAVDAAASYAAFRSQATQFLIENAASDYKQINLLMRPELLDGLDDTLYETGSGITELDRLTGKFKSVVTSSNALAAPAGGPPVSSTAVMTVSTGGIAPFYVATWGAIDMIRDPFTKAASGQLVLTGLITADCTASRSEQVRILTGLE